MNERSHSLQKIRPELPSAKTSKEMSDEERFQNITLRPIIKLQNILLLASFQNYITKRKNHFYGLTLEQRMDYIAYAIQKDAKFRNSIKGMVLGHFTIEEYAKYCLNASALNKRMMHLVVKRLQDQIQYFDSEALV